MLAWRTPQTRHSSGSTKARIPPLRTSYARCWTCWTVTIELTIYARTLGFRDHTSSQCGLGCRTLSFRYCHDRSRILEPALSGRSNLEGLSGVIYPSSMVRCIPQGSSLAGISCITTRYHLAAGSISRWRTSLGTTCFTVISIRLALSAVSNRSLGGTRSMVRSNTKQMPLQQIS